MSENLYNIKLVAIELISKSLNPPPSDLSGKEDFNFPFRIDLKLLPDSKNAIIETTTDIVRVKESKSVASFKILCVFEFPDFDSVFTRKNHKQYNIPIELEIMLKSLGFSTIRGIIASEIRGTYLHGAVLPLVDMDSLIRSLHKQVATTDLKGDSQ